MFSQKHINPFSPAAFQWRVTRWGRRQLSTTEKILFLPVVGFSILPFWLFHECSSPETYLSVFFSIFLVLTFIALLFLEWCAVTINRLGIKIVRSKKIKSWRNHAFIRFEEISRFDVTFESSSQNHDYVLDLYEKQGAVYHLPISSKVDRFALQEYLAQRVGNEVTSKEAEFFDLARNKAAIFSMVLMAMLGIYSFADGMFFEEAYVSQPEYLYMAAGGGILFILSLGFLIKSEVPKPEAATLAILLGLLCGVALYPGLLRVNQITDTDGLHIYAYTYAGKNVLAPVDTMLPQLEIQNDFGYWESFSKDYVFMFPLRKGGLGFYQVNLEPIYSDMRDFYTNRRERP